jgi:hypothetical protein
MIFRTETSAKDATILADLKSTFCVRLGISAHRKGRVKVCSSHFHFRSAGASILAPEIARALALRKGLFS